jgi:hypothetical protein
MKQGAFNSLADILKGENKFVIPDLQRDYCWGTTVPKGKKDSLVYSFTNELINESPNQYKYDEWSYGILYTYEFPESFLHLCDGQQRLTTLYLIIGILNCHIRNTQLLEILMLANGQPRLKYEVRNTTDYFIKDLLKEVFLKQEMSDLKDLTKANWFREEYADDPSIKSMVKAIKVINELINKDNTQEVSSYILSKVGFIYIKLDANELIEKRADSAIREYSEKIYEIVNTHGNPMKSNEHMNSLLLSQLKESEKQNGTEKCAIWQDFYWQYRVADELIERRANSAIREYGEKMYEIVNTRGNPMESNEHIKSRLLSQLKESEKQNWTEKWEIWQDFFWQNRGVKLSADEGFNEFLNWIEVIEGDSAYSLEIVEAYFKAFFFLINVQDDLLKYRKHTIANIKAKFLENQKPEMVVLYPCLIYFKNTIHITYENKDYHVSRESINHDDLFRYIRFFSNLAKNTTTSRESITIANLLRKGFDNLQITDLESEKINELLSKEELFKLRLYVSAFSSEERRIIEDSLWLAEDHVYLNGKIKPLFKWMKLDVKSNSVENFVLSDFDKVYQLLLELISDSFIEKVRIALLALSDNFSVFREGYSWGAERYYLGLSNDFGFWRKNISSNLFQSIIMMVMDGNPIDTIINEAIENTGDGQRKAIIKLLMENGTKHWQWIYSKRFFIFENCLRLPNGERAKENTEKIPIV